MKHLIISTFVVFTCFSAIGQNKVQHRIQLSNNYDLLTKEGYYGKSINLFGFSYDISKKNIGMEVNYSLGAKSKVVDNADNNVYFLSQITLPNTPDINAYKYQISKKSFGLAFRYGINISEKLELSPQIAFRFDENDYTLFQIEKSNQNTQIKIYTSGQSQHPQDRTDIYMGARLGLNYFFSQSFGIGTQLSLLHKTNNCISCDLSDQASDNFIHSYNLGLNLIFKI